MNGAEMGGEGVQKRSGWRRQRPATHRVSRVSVIVNKGTWRRVPLRKRLRLRVAAWRAGCRIQPNSLCPPDKLYALHLPALEQVPLPSFADLYPHRRNNIVLSGLIQTAQEPKQASITVITNS